jgi:hypothetical protein
MYASGVTRAAVTARQAVEMSPRECEDSPSSNHTRVIRSGGGSPFAAGTGSLLGATLGRRGSARAPWPATLVVFTGQGRIEGAAQRICSAENRAQDRRDALAQLEVGSDRGFRPWTSGRDGLRRADDVQPVERSWAGVQRVFVASSGPQNRLVSAGPSLPGTCSSRSVTSTARPSTSSTRRSESGVSLSSLTPLCEVQRCRRSRGGSSS